MKCLCTFPISIAISRSKLWSFETKQSQNIKLILILFLIKKKIFWIYPKFFGENLGSKQNFMAHVLWYTANLTLQHDDYFIAQCYNE